jgi:hypothetical protein
MTQINFESGLLRLWIFTISCLAFFTFICELVGYNFYWLIPMPFKDLCIHLHNFLLDFFDIGIYNPVGLALISALSSAVVIGSSTFVIGYGITWVTKGFRRD